MTSLRQEQLSTI